MGWPSLPSLSVVWWSRLNWKGRGSKAMPSLRRYKRRGDKLLPCVSSQTRSSKVYDNDQSNWESCTDSSLDLHFMNRVAVQGNPEKPIREGSFSNYCQALEEPLKGVGGSAALGRDRLARLPGRPGPEGEWPPLGGGRAELG